MFGVQCARPGRGAQTAQAKSGIAGIDHAPFVAKCAPPVYAPITMTGGILLFDSGVGGLSVLKPVRMLLPHAPLIYAADNAGFPYGGRSEAEIAARVPALLGRLAERYHPQLIVIACNTASTIALPHVRAALDLPIVGTVPAIKPAAALSKSRVIGVLGTPATIRQAYVDKLSEEHAADCTVLRHGAPGLAALAEAKLRGETPSPAAFRAEIAGLLEQTGADRMDALVLACTHFPLVEDELRAAIGRDIAFVDGGAGIARRVAHLTKGVAWPEVPVPGRAVFTAHDDRWLALRPVLQAHGLSEVDIL